MTDTYLQLKWSTSRGRDTYGYNIVTLTDTSTGRRYRATGGGYDMTGTVFGEWLAENWGSAIIVDLSDKTEDFYGLSLRDGKLRLDGACGLESMRLIAEAAGLNVRVLVGRKGSTDGFIVTDKS